MNDSDSKTKDKPQQSDRQDGHVHARSAFVCCSAGRPQGNPPAVPHLLHARGMDCPGAASVPCRTLFLEEQLIFPLLSCIFSAAAPAGSTPSPRSHWIDVQSIQSTLLDCVEAEDVHNMALQRALTHRQVLELSDLLLRLRPLVSITPSIRTRHDCRLVDGSHLRDADRRVDRSIDAVSHRLQQQLQLKSRLGSGQQRRLPPAEFPESIGPVDVVEPHSFNSVGSPGNASVQRNRIGRRRLRSH